MRLFAGLLVTLATAHAGDAEIFSAPAIEARLARLRPMTEEVLGRPIPGEMRVVVVSRDRWVEGATADAVRHRGAIAGEKRGKELEEDCRKQAELYSYSILASVSGDIFLIAENFSQFTGAEVRDVLDIVLVHEMAHVFQARALGSKWPLEDGEEATAHGALVEGHARYVSHRVAERLDLGAAFARLQCAQALEAPEHFAANVWIIFRYGDGERFFGAVVDRLGYAEAERRTFCSPPLTIGEIAHPPDYLSGARSDGLRPLADAVLAVLGAPDEEILSLPPPVMRRQLSAAGSAAVARAMGGVRSTVAFTPRIRYGALAGRAANVALTDTVSPAAARVLFDTVRQATRDECEELFLPDGARKVFWAAHEDIDLAGARAFRASRVVRRRGAASHSNVESIVLLHDRLVVRLFVTAPREEREHLWRLARCVLGMMRGDPRAGALDGAPEQRFLALVALESPRPACLRKLLRDPCLDVRVTALARATLLALLRQALEDPSLRPHAARLASRHAEAAPLLVALLDDVDPRVRENALVALDELGWAKRAGRAELLARLEDTEPGVRRAALSLVAKAKAVPDEERRALLLVYTEDAVAPVRLAAWSLLDDLGKPKEIPAAAWRRGLEDPSDAVRSQVMFDADDGSLPEEELALRFASALHDRDLWVRRWAAMVMDRFASHAKPVLPDLIRALEDDETRSGVISTLSEMRAPARDALPALLALVEVRDVRREVIEALGQISQRDDKVEAVLHAALDDHNAGIRLAAARALDEVGASLPDLSPILLPVLEQGDASSRSYAAEMLGQQKRADAKPALLRALEDPSDSVRASAAEALIAIDPTPETVVTAARMLLDSDSWVRRSTAWALERLEAAAAPAVPMVIRAMERSEPDEMDDYCDILESVGPAAREALPALRKLLQHENEEIRREAQEAIDCIEAT